MGNNCQNLCSIPNLKQITKPSFEICCTTRTDCELNQKQILQQHPQSYPNSNPKQSVATRETEDEKTHEKNYIKYPLTNKNTNNAVIRYNNFSKETDTIIENIEADQNEKKTDFIFVGSQGFSFGKDGKKLEECQTFKNVSVPFKVVKLTLATQLVKNILKNFPSFFQEQTNQSWQLIKKGFYIKDASDGTKNHRYILNSHAFYSGQYTGNPQRPSQLIGKTGTYVTDKYIYKGGFYNGKAHDFGELTYDSSIYRGTWQRGCLVKGKIQNNKYSFEGQLRQNRPHGQGTFILHNQNINYQGKFYKGYFHDPNAFYQCLAYRYEGGFKKGKKHGFGAITLTDSKQKYEGDWQYDVLVSVKQQSKGVDK